MHQAHIKVLGKDKGPINIYPFISFPLSYCASGQALMKRNEPKKNLAKRNFHWQGPRVHSLVIALEMAKEWEAITNINL